MPRKALKAHCWFYCAIQSQCQHTLRWGCTQGPTLLVGPITTDPPTHIPSLPLVCTHAPNCPESQWKGMWVMHNNGNGSSPPSCIHWPVRTGKGKADGAGTGFASSRRKHGQMGACRCVGEKEGMREAWQWAVSAQDPPILGTVRREQQTPTCRRACLVAWITSWKPVIWCTFSEVLSFAGFQLSSGWGTLGKPSDGAQQLLKYDTGTCRGMEKNLHLAWPIAFCHEFLFDTTSTKSFGPHIPV